MYTTLAPYDELTTNRPERRLDESVPAPVVARTRGPRSALMVFGAIGLIPLIVLFAITTPTNYVVHSWPAISAGIDVVAVAFMITTAVLVFRRRQWVPLTAFATGVLLICDAWFDVMTSGPHDVWASALSAMLVEVPLAVILMTTALRVSAADRAAVAAA